MGSLFGGYIANLKSKQYSTNVCLFGRKNHVDAINLKGLSIISPSSQILNIKNIRAFTDLKSYMNNNINKNGIFDYMILSTKAYDIKNALSEYSDLLENAEFLILLQNGIGNEDIVKKSISKSKIIRLVTSHGAVLANPGKIKHTGKGFTKIGYPFKKNVFETHGEKTSLLKLREFKELLDLVGIQTNIVSDIIANCWEKTFINIGINAIGTLCRLKNGELLEIQEIKFLMKEAIKEAIKVANLKNIDIPNNDFVTSSYDVALKTKNNINSMLQDIIKGNKTEIDFLNGKIVQYANESGLEVPINKILTYLIKGLEKSKI